MEAAAGSVKVHHKVKDLISSPHSPSVSSSWSTETHSSSRFSLIITQSTIHLDSPGVCSRVVPFRRLLEGSCLRRTRSVGSWSEKSVRDNLKKNKKKQVSAPQTVQLFSLRNLIQHLGSPGLCRRLVSPLDWRSDPPSAWCRHTPARPAAHPSLRPPGRWTGEQERIIFTADCLETVSDLCCPPVVPSLTCTSSTLGCVNRNCSTSAG